MVSAQWYKSHLEYSNRDEFIKLGVSSIIICWCGVVWHLHVRRICSGGRIMSIIFYTKNGEIQYIQSDGMSIPADNKNRDYRKVMAQDAITPFERVEIVETEPDNTPSLQEQI